MGVPAISPTAPTPPPTSYPTKKYHPLPDDNENEDGKEGPIIWKVFLWVVVIFSLTWMLFYFRFPIFYFFQNLINNTQRFGCKGCLGSLSLAFLVDLNLEVQEGA